jgi:hypothetical protein
VSSEPPQENNQRKGISMFTPNRFANRSKRLLLVFGLALASFAVGQLSVPRAAEPAQGSSQRTVRTLQEQRLTALRKVTVLMERGQNNGYENLSEVLAARQAATEAELDLCATEKERAGVLVMLLELAKSVEAQAAQHAHGGYGDEATALRATADRLQVEIRLEQARAASSESSK